MTTRMSGGRKIVIADGGSTKCKWAVVSTSGAWLPLRTFTSCGVNPLQLSEGEIAGLWKGEVEALEAIRGAEAVYYYGAGCIGGEADRRIAAAVMSLTGVGSVAVFSDMLGAARALLGRRSGVACILGTGCNSCLYDGGGIVRNIRPLGYILGDEGSGADIGKHLVADALKGLLPKDLDDEFYAFADAGYSEIVRRVYSEPRANAYLASFVPFVARHIQRAEMRNLVTGRFEAFLRRNVMLYGQAALQDAAVGFTGGVATQFEAQLRHVCREAGLGEVAVVSDPLPGLVDYHLKTV
ncbi:MAG: BadF/BadG/BcrA/BcrD ATPase family protein [Marinilabiliaceae bacterium]